MSKKSTVTDQASSYVSHTRLNTFFIICQEGSVIPARLQIVYNGKFVLTVKKKYQVADLFSAGFRIDGLFITIEMMNKTLQIEDGEMMIVEAMIFGISETEQIKLNGLWSKSTRPSERLLCSS